MALKIKSKKIKAKRYKNKGIIIYAKTRKHPGWVFFCVYREMG